MSFFKTKSVASVLGAFTKTIADLNQVNKENLAAAEMKYENAAESVRQAQDHLKEASVAAVVSSRLSNLLNINEVMDGIQNFIDQEDNEMDGFDYTNVTDIRGENSAEEKVAA